MRVIAGKFKGLQLDYPKLRQFRPTQDRVKEAIFSIIHSQCEESEVLDLCCGTGGLGIEALSRGADHVTFVDINIGTLKKNVSKLPSDTQKDQVTIIKAATKHYLERNDIKVDIILLDPPWNNVSIYEDALQAIGGFGILKPSGLLVCESHKKMELKMPKQLKKDSCRHYGDTEITIIKQIS